MLKPCNQMNFIIISLTEPKSLDIDNLSIKSNFKCITDNFYLHFDKTGVVCVVNQATWNHTNLLNTYGIPNWKKMACY